MRASKEARLAERHREQVARLIVDCGALGLDTLRRLLEAQPRTPEEGRRLAIAAVLDGARFAVHAVRAYGERLMEKALRASGPEHVAVLDDWLEAHGGTKRAVESPFRPYGNGLAFARQAQRLLAAIEGQPSECPVPLCNNGQIDHRHPRPPTHRKGRCADCHGTGHNLAGTLPTLTVSPQRRRSLSDAAAHSDTPEQLDPRQGQAIEALTRESQSWDLFDTPLDAMPDPARPLARLAHVEQATANGRRPFPAVFRVERELTRDVPRGQHRAWLGDGEAPWRPKRVSPVHVHRWPLPEGVHGPVLQTFHRKEFAPRWRRGELRHAEQRRSRSVRVPAGTVLPGIIRPIEINVEFSLVDNATEPMDRIREALERVDFTRAARIVERARLGISTAIMLDLDDGADP